MQINIALEKNSVEQAKKIRNVWYPTTTARQTRDAFIFNDCIDRYKGNTEDLLAFIERNNGNITIQRKLTIKSESNERLKTIASAIDKPLATTYRAIIAYTIDNLDADEGSEKTTPLVGVSLLLRERLAMLEKQLDACNQTLKEIKELAE